jgi:hypothetical protein
MKNNHECKGAFAVIEALIAIKIAATRAEAMTP